MCRAGIGGNPTPKPGGRGKAMATPRAYVCSYIRPAESTYLYVCMYEVQGRERLYRTGPRRVDAGPLVFDV